MPEFFCHNSNLTTDKIMLINSQRYIGFNSISADQRFRFLNLLKVSDEAMRCISAMGQYNINDINAKLVQFIRCNFAELDQVDDITEDNVLNFEYVNCGFKGNNHCPFAKKFCVIKTKSINGPRC